MSMTTVRYGRYVCANVDEGQIVWYESREAAIVQQREHGGRVFDMDEDDQEEIEQALMAARRQMGIE